MDPTNSAQVKCNISSLAAADSAQQPLQLQFDGPAACDCMLQTLLRVLSQVVLLQPQSLASQLPASLLQGASCLLVCNSCGLQAAALDFVATVLLASSMPRPELRGLPDRLGATLQAFSLRQATCEPSVRAAWYQGLVKTLHALLNVISQSHDRRRALQQVASIALNESGSAEMGSAQQDALLQLFAEAVLKDPFILQSNVHALDCLKTCSQSSRTALLTAVRWCLDQVPVEQAQQALQQAARLGNGAMEAVIAKDGPQKTPASVKRRRTAKQADPMVVDSGGADAAASLPPGAVALATALVQAAKSLQKDTSNSSIQALADVLIMISPLAPSVALRLSSSALHSSRRLQTLLARGHSLTEESLGATFGVLVSCLDAAVAVHSQGESILQGDAESVLGATKEALYVGQNSNGKCAVARMAGALLAAQLDLVDCAATVLATLNGGNTTLDETAKAGRAALLPAAACLYSIKAGSGSEGQQASKQKSHPSNPFAPLLLEVAGSSDDRIRAAAAQGIRLAIEWAHDPGIMVCQAVRVAFSGGQGPPLPHDPAVRPSLTAAVSEWARPTLDALCGISPGMREEREAKAQAEAEARAHRRKQEQKEDAVVLLPPGPPPSLDQLAAVREFLVHGSLGQLEHSWGLAKWLMAQTASPAPAVRAAALRGCEVFTSAHFLLAAYHKGSHPVHSHDRSAAADRCEQSAVNEIRSRSAAVIADLDVFEDQLQLATRVGCLMRTSVAQMLILTFLVHGLDFREPGPVAMAAQCMRGGCSNLTCFLCSRHLPKDNSSA